MTDTTRQFSRRRILTAGIAAPALCAMPWVLDRARASETVELQFMYPVGVSGDINTIITGMIGRFNEQHPGIRVEPIYAGSYENTEQKVVTDIGVGAPPALWLPINSALQTFLGLDALEDLTDVARADDIYEDFISGFLDTCIDNGRLYGLSFQPSTPVLYYNKTAFADAGLTAAPDDWDGLFSAAKALTLRDGDAVKRWGLTVGGGWHDWIFEAFCRQNDFLPWSRDGVMWDQPPAIEALSFWREMVQAGAMAPASTWQGSANDFMAGATAMLYHSTGSLTNLRTSSSFPVGVAMMPKRKSWGASQGGGPLMIAKNQSDAKKQAAWTFARWMTSTDVQAEWGMATGYLAVRKSSWATPAMTAYLEKVPEARTALDQAEYSGPYLQVPGYAKARDVIKSAIDRTLAGEVAPEPALTAAAAEMNREIARLTRRQRG